MGSFNMTKRSKFKQWLTEYTHWKFKNKTTINNIYTVLAGYGILFIFAMLASADTICNRWFPVCIGWFD